MREGMVVIICLSIYIGLLLIMGFYAKSTRKSESLKAFYLADNGLSSFVLLFTLYATQYSANTLLIVPAEVVNQGYGMILILGYMTAIVVCYLMYAPALYQRARTRDYITPGDYFDDRFDSPGLSLLANAVFLIVSTNYLLAQLMAMGYITESLTGGLISYEIGVCALACIVIVYESLGGMRAVAWTDVLQGGMLLVGLVGIFIIVGPNPSRLGEVSEWLIENDSGWIDVPSFDFQIYWASTVFMVGMGAAIYPQAIQRLYAARSLRSLKRSLSWMVIMPMFTVLILFLLGVLSIPHYEIIEGSGQDAVLPEMLHYWSEQSVIAGILVLLITVGLIAAIMSTADSVLLSMSSIIVKDIIAKNKWSSLPEEKLTRYGKWISVIIMVALIFWALNPQVTLFGLIELKMQLLIQLAPLFLFGLYYNTRSQSLFLGLMIGLIIAIVCFLLGVKNLWHVQIGVIALVINVLIVLFSESVFRSGESPKI